MVNKKTFTVSVIIPNYNGAHLLKTNLPKIIRQLNRSKNQCVKEIIIVDDCSTDNSINQINNLIQEFTNQPIALSLFQNKKNSGFSETVNKGVSIAKGDLAFLLNSDVYFEKDPLVQVISNFGQDSNLFAVGLLDESKESTTTVLRGRGLACWEKGFLLHKKGEADKTDTFWVNGGSGIFRKQIWDKLGGMNKLYNPFYWEDIDLSYRAKKSGYSLLFEPKATVIHEHEKGAISSNFSPLRVREISYKNQILFVWLNITDLSFLVSHAGWLIIHITSAIIHGNSAFVRGFISALKAMPKVMVSRKKNKSLFIRSDQDLIHSEYSS
jgi:GT2 family glycosyltransferase